MTWGEIAHFEQFLLLLHCFHKSSAAEVSENVCMLESVKQQEAQEGQYRSTAIKKKLNLQTVPPIWWPCFSTNQFGLKESDRG